MSKPAKNKARIFLIVLIVLVLVGACFAVVAIYAKKEMNKEKFRKPADPPRPAVVEVPEGDDAVYALVKELYAAAVGSAYAEGSWHTDVNLAGDLSLPFSQADNEIVSYIRDQAAGQIAPLYPSGSGVVMAQAENTPSFEIPRDSVLEITTEPDGDFCTVTFKVDPAFAEIGDLAGNDVYKGICEKLAPAFSLQSCTLEPETVTVSYRIDLAFGRLESVSCTRHFKGGAEITLTDAYAPLLPDGQKTAEVGFPYETTETLSFSWYGARFTERSIVVASDAEEALPAAVTVNAAVTEEDYELQFTFSEEGVLEIDHKTGVMKVLRPSSEPVVVTMWLELDNGAFKSVPDTITVYITDLEVETTNG